MDIYTAMKETRAMRRLLPDPVPEHLLREVVEYAMHAGSGANAWNVRFIIVRHPETKARISALYRSTWQRFRSGSPMEPTPDTTADKLERTNRATDWQAEHLMDAPALIFPCLAGARPLLTDKLMGRSANAAVFLAVQNLLLACRAKGLGATLTTLHLASEGEIDRLLGLPEDAATFAMIPVGFPMGKFGPTRGVPVVHTLCWETWHD